MTEMINQSIAHRYAKALFDIGLEHNALSRYYEEWKNLVEIIGQVKEASSIFYSQAVPAQEKKQLARVLFGDKFDEVILNLLFIIFDKSRESYLSEILISYEDLMDERQGVVKVGVVSAGPLTQEQKEELSAVLSQKLNKKIRLQTDVDETLIAGIRLRLGDKIYDASVSRQIELLKQQLIH